MKLISFDDIKELNIDPLTCYDWVVETLKNKKKATLPPKISMHLDGDGFCNVMPCIIKNDEKLMGGVKVVNRYPKRMPSLDSRLMLLDMETGDFLALMDANWITAMRTGAVAAHSINLLAKSDFKTICFIGLGNVARSTMLEVAELFKGKELEIRLLRYKDQAEQFIERFSGYANLHFTIMDDVKKMIKGSDVVVSCATYFAEDIATDDCFDEGVLVVPVHTRGFTNCDLFFDKVFADDTGHVCHFKNFEKFKYFSETCDVMDGTKLGRENDKERILAYNIGLSIHDMNYASHIYGMIKENEGIKDFDVREPKEKFWI